MVIRRGGRVVALTVASGDVFRAPEKVSRLLMKIHPVFHVSKLEPCAIDSLPSNIPPPAPPVIVEGKEELEVDEILDSRLRYGSLQYLVRWKGYDTPMWKPAENVSNIPTLLSRFHRLYPH